jgi:hypothetical protein
VKLEQQFLVLRTGADDEGVIGLRPTGLPDEHEPGLSVRCAGIDALGVLDNVEIT